MDFSEEMFHSILPEDLPDENPIESVVSGINTLLVAACCPKIELEKVDDKYRLRIEEGKWTPLTTHNEVFIWLNGFGSGLLSEKRGSMRRR